MNRLKKLYWYVFILFVEFCTLVSTTTDSLLDKEFALQMDQIKESEMKRLPTETKKPNWANLFERQNFATKIIAKLTENPESEYLYDSYLREQFQQKPYSYQYVILHSYLFSVTPSLDNPDDYFTSVLVPLLTSENNLQWRVFFCNDFRALLSVTAERTVQSVASVACIRKFHFYDTLLQQLDQRQNDDEDIYRLHYREIFKELQVIIYNHLRKFNGWESEHVFYLIKSQNNLYISRTKPAEKGDEFIPTEFAWRITGRKLIHNNVIRPPVEFIKAFFQGCPGSAMFTWILILATAGYLFLIFVYAVFFSVAYTMYLFAALLSLCRCKFEQFYIHYPMSWLLRKVWN